MTNAPMIDLRDTTKKYDDGPPALAGVTLSVAAGECVAILGHSGSGKSTLLNLIAGLDKPSSGTVTVDGTRVDQLGEAGSAKYRRASIGMIFQFFNLLDDLTVLDNVMVPAQLAGMGKGEAKRRAVELLGSLGIDRHAKAYPQRLVRRSAAAGGGGQGPDELPGAAAGRRAHRRSGLELGRGRAPAAAGPEQPRARPSCWSPTTCSWPRAPRAARSSWWTAPSRGTSSTTAAVPAWPPARR